ncbi:MAG: radical SAM protein [Ruminococcaceae bacterium]|nr:radical SAM protein [Oscillospiraceae bacterium]
MHIVEAKGILSNSGGMNIYRGCSHGCIYCDSRSVCYNMHHEFEDIEVKINAAELLENALRKKKSPIMVGTGSMCDPYMHIENELKLTRKCLQIIEKYGFGATVITKSKNVLRDMDLYKSINKKSKAVIQMTLTTFDESLCKILEPNVSTTKERFEALMEFKKENIPTVVWLSPILPFVNDTEENLRGILNYCFEAGVKGILCFGMGLTLREGNREYFYKALDKYFPGLKEKYIKKYGGSYSLLSDNNIRLMNIFHSECEKHGVMHEVEEIFSYLHKFPFEEQISLF